MASARTKIRVFSQDGTPLAEYLLGEGVHTMGRDPSSAIYLESDYVSNEHARLHLSSTGVAIEDLNSTSGTYLDEVAVRGKLDIEPGQKIRVGDLQVDLEVEGVGEIAAGATLGAGRYTLMQELGRGAMGTVWLATDNELQEEVAIKLLAPELAGDAVTLADLKREVQKSRKLSHENIIRIHDLNNLPGELPFITMEYIRGSNMDAIRLNQPDGLMSWELLRPILLQLCEALDYAHRQKIVHRDLKPANMMVTEDYTLKLADFGIAATLNDSTARSSLAGTVSGTLVYMSPQQLQGEDPRGSDDIYALGSTLYNLIAGHPPFKSGDIRGQILNQSPTPLTQVMESAGIKSDIPDYVSSLVMSCLAKEPEGRPANGKAIVEWIVTEGKSELLPKKETAYMDAAPVQQSQPVVPSAPSKGGKKLVYGIAAALVALLVIGGVIFMGKGEKEPNQGGEGANEIAIDPNNPLAKAIAANNGDLKKALIQITKDNPDPLQLDSEGHISFLIINDRKLPAECLSLLRGPAVQHITLLNLGADFGQGEVIDEELKYLKQLPSLKKLYLGRNITDDGLAYLAAEFPHLVNLQFYYRKGVGPTNEGLKKLNVFNRLDYLKLGYFDFNNPDILEFLRSMPLKALDFPHSILSDAAIQKVATLKPDLRRFFLSLDDNQPDQRLTDQSLQYIQNIKSLEELNIKGYRFSKPALDQLQKALPKCKINYNPTK